MTVTLDLPPQKAQARGLSLDAVVQESQRGSVPPIEKALPVPPL